MGKLGPIEFTEESSGPCNMTVKTMIIIILIILLAAAISVLLWACLKPDDTGSVKWPKGLSDTCAAYSTLAGTKISKPGNDTSGPAEWTISKKHMIEGGKAPWTRTDGFAQPTKLVLWEVTPIKDMTDDECKSAAD